MPPRAKSARVKRPRPGRTPLDRLRAICLALPETTEKLAWGEPTRFFRPPYVGPRGWVGVRIDGKPDWATVAKLVEQAHREVARRR